MRSLRLPALLLQTIGVTALNFPTPLLLLALPAIWRRADSAPPTMRWVLVGGIIVHGTFAARYNVPDQYTFLIPTFVLLALFIAMIGTPPL